VALAEMGKIKKKPCVKLFMGILYADEVCREHCYRIIVKKLGEIDSLSNPVAFRYTDYYEEEMGKSLWRQYITFQKLVEADCLAEIKNWTNLVENEFYNEEKRRINLDPGYISLAQVVLATTKDSSHRVYLGRGIYAEVTLFYRSRSFFEWPWTYPDYRDPLHIQYFNRVRQDYLLSLHKS